MLVLGPILGFVGSNFLAVLLHVSLLSLLLAFSYWHLYYIYTISFFVRIGAKKYRTLILTLQLIVSQQPVDLWRVTPYLSGPAHDPRNVRVWNIFDLLLAVSISKVEHRVSKRKELGCGLFLLL